MKMVFPPVSKPNNPNNSLFNGGSEWLADFDNDPDFYSTANREYDPVLGRFNGLDPLAESFTSWSPYSFSFNNPVIYSDPSGAAPISDDTLAMLYELAARLDDGEGLSFYKNSNGGWGFELFTIAPNSQVSWGDDRTGYITAIQWYHAPDGKPVTSDNVSATAWVMEIPSLKNNGNRSSGGNSNSTNQGRSGIDKGGAIDATIGILGGTAEVILGVGGEAFTGGLSTVMIIDGVYRIGMNSARLTAYLTSNADVGNALPSNIGGMVGKLIDGGEFSKVGKMQTVLGATNDFATFLMTGGNASAWESLLKSPNSLKGAASLIGISANMYSVGNYGNWGQK